MTNRWGFEKLTLQAAPHPQYDGNLPPSIGTTICKYCSPTYKTGYAALNPNCTIPDCTIPNCTIIDSTISDGTILDCTIPDATMLHYTIPASIKYLTPGSTTARASSCCCCTPPATSANPIKTCIQCHPISTPTTTTTLSCRNGSMKSTTTSNIIS